MYRSSNRAVSFVFLCGFRGVHYLLCFLSLVEPLVAHAITDLGRVATFRALKLNFKVSISVLRLALILRRFRRRPDSRSKRSSIPRPSFRQPPPRTISKPDSILDYRWPHPEVNLALHRRICSILLRERGQWLLRSILQSLPLRASSLTQDRRITV